MDPEYGLVPARMTPVPLHRSEVALLIPTRNAVRAGFWKAWIAAVRSQSVQPGCVIVADSRSQDETVALAQAQGWPVLPVTHFNHGRTRNQLIGQCPKAAILVFMTQDAILAEPDSLRKLLEPFADHRVAAVTARQLARPGADFFETQARRFNYPEQSRITLKSDIAELGIKAAFVSNSCCAWRRSALEEIGYFPEALTGEDTLAGFRLLEAGWKLVYNAQALVIHSHNFTITAEARRYFDIGVTHAQHQDYLQRLGPPEKEGTRFLRHQLAGLWKTQPWATPKALLRIFAKYGAYRLGRQYQRLPCRIRPHLSSQPNYWTTKDCA